MDAKAKELTKIINICKKMGVIELKMDGIEVKLLPSAVQTHSKYKQKKSEEKESEPTYSEDDTLFWSVQGAGV